MRGLTTCMDRVQLPHAGTYHTRKFSSGCGVLDILLKHTVIYR